MFEYADTIEKMSEAEIDKRIEKLLGRPLNQLEDPRNILVGKDKKMKDKKKQEKKIEKPKQESVIEEAPLIGTTPIDMDKVLARYAYIKERPNSPEWFRGVFRIGNRIFTCKHPDAQIGKIYRVAIKQFDTIVKEGDFQVIKVSEKFDFCELKGIPDDSVANDIPSYRIKDPKIGDVVFILYNIQNTNTLRVERGKVIKIRDDGLVEYEIYTDYGASGCAVAHVIGPNSIAAIHLQAGSTGRFNVGQTFTPALKAEFNLN